MRLRFLLIAAVLLVTPAAFGGTYSLNDWCFYVNSLDVNRSCNNGSGVDNFNPPVDPGTFDYYHLNDNQNTLGTAVITVGPGSYNVFAIFNYDLGGDGGTNEFARVFGNLAIGQVYAVGSSGSTTGGLYSQFAAGTLDNQNYVPTCAGNSCPDVSVSLGYTNLVVPQGQNAQVTYSVSDTTPSSGFYIQQAQNGSGSTLNYSSAVTLTQAGGGFNAAIELSAPEPGTVLLIGGGIALMFLGLRRRKV